MASATTIANLQRMPASTLAELLLAQQAGVSDPLTATSGGPDVAARRLSTRPIEVAIIDVRDDDHIGGHIRTSQHIPSATLDYAIPTLVRKLADTPVVVFHCALSQQRGPTAALRYLRERERLLSGKGAVGKKMKKTAVEDEAKKREMAEDEAGKEGKEEWEYVDGAEDEEQKVYVLENGFQGWQAVYGGDKRLTEGYRKELWSDYY